MIKYEKYIEEVRKSYKYKKEDISIFITFEIMEKNCVYQIARNNSNETKGVLKESNFIFDESYFEEFFLPIIKEYISINEVVISTVIEADNLVGLASLKIITKSNDILTIKGISMENANELLDIINDRKQLDIKKEVETIKNENNNQSGIGNTMVIILTMIMIGMTLAGTIFFTIASR